MLRKILVTGGAGYIGSHCCKLLAESGYEPVVYDNLIYGHPWAIKWGPFVKGDISNTVLLKESLIKYQIDAVLHFAAFAYVGESVSKPDIYYSNNVVGSLQLLTAMRETGVKKIVFSSTCATYGNPQMLPLPETHPQNPINPYGKSKLMVETILQDFKFAYQIDFVCLRYFNAAGADPSSEIGEAHHPETHLIPLTLNAALGKSPNLTVFGIDYPTFDGSCIRDYIHVNDLAQAHLLALKALDSGKSAEAYNIGNGKGFSVKEVIQATEKVTGKKIPVIYGDRRLGDPPSLIADSSKLIRELNWEPQYSELETIIETAYQFMLKKPF